VNKYFAYRRKLQLSKKRVQIHSLAIQMVVKFKEKCVDHTARRGEDEVVL